MEHPQLRMALIQLDNQRQYADRSPGLTFKKEVKGSYVHLDCGLKVTMLEYHTWVPSPSVYKLITLLVFMSIENNIWRKWIIIL